MLYISKIERKLRLYSVSQEKGQDLLLDKSTTCEITELKSPIWKFGEQFTLKLVLGKEEYYISENELNNYFKPANISHYETELFTSVNAMNDYLQNIPVDQIKNIKMDNDKYLVIRIVKGDI